MAASTPVTTVTRAGERWRRQKADRSALGMGRLTKSSSLNQSPGIQDTNSSLVSRKTWCESEKNSYKYSLSGLSLAFLSGGIFTANNFLINQFHVSVPDLLLVRTLMQMLIYSSICYYRWIGQISGLFHLLTFLLQGSVPVTRAEQSEDADRAAGRHVLPDLHHGPVRRLLHASPGRPLHRVLLPRGHHHPLRHRAQGDYHSERIIILRVHLRIGLAQARLLLLSCSSLVWCSCVNLHFCSTHTHTKS